MSKLILDPAYVPRLSAGTTYYHWPLIDGQNPTSEDIAGKTLGITGSVGWYGPEYTPSGHANVVQWAGTTGMGEFYRSDSDLNIGTSNFSFAAWLYLQTEPERWNPNLHGIISKYENSSASAGYVFMLSSSIFYLTFHKISPDEYENYTKNWGTSIFPADEWFHFAVSVERGVLATYYKNANVIGTQINTGGIVNCTNIGPFWAGVFPYQANNWVRLCGRMVDMWFIKRTITADEVRSMYKFYGTP